MFPFLAVMGAGVATLASPCILPLLPVYFAMMLGGSSSAIADAAGRRRLLWMTLAFSLGFTLVFTAAGTAASSLGALLNGHRAALTVGGAALMVLMGLAFLDVLKVSALQRDVRFNAPKVITGLPTGFLFGVVFALGWTPCAGPVLGSVLGYAALQGNQAAGAALLAAYSAGLAIPLLLVAALADRALPLLRRVTPRLPLIHRVSGVAMVGAGLLLGIPALPGLTSSGSEIPEALDTHGVTLSPALGGALPRPRLLEFVSRDCPVCQRMAPAVATLEHDCVDHLVDIHTVDITADENQSLRLRLAIPAVPAFVLVDDQGVVRATLVGERTLDELRGLMAHLQATACMGVAPLEPSLLQDGVHCQPGADEATRGSCG